MAGLLALPGLISFPSLFNRTVENDLIKPYNRITAAGTAPEFPFWYAEQVTGFPFNVRRPYAFGQPYLTQD
jgi:hypothetical protein